MEGMLRFAEISISIIGHDPQKALADKNFPLHAPSSAVRGRVGEGAAERRGKLALYSPEAPGYHSPFQWLEQTCLPPIRPGPQGGSGVGPEPGDVLGVVATKNHPKHRIHPKPRVPKREERIPSFGRQAVTGQRLGGRASRRGGAPPEARCTARASGSGCPAASTRPTSRRSVRRCPRARLPGVLRALPRRRRRSPHRRRLGTIAPTKTETGGRSLLGRWRAPPVFQRMARSATLRLGAPVEGRRLKASHRGGLRRENGGCCRSDLPVRPGVRR